MEEGNDGLCCSDCTSSQAVKAHQWSCSMFQVGRARHFFFFRNGSLACNIIRNTLGHHLIFLQCDHMRKFVLMRRAQVWLVTLSLSLRVLLSLSVCCIAVSPIRHDLASCSTSSSRVSKTNPAAFSYGTCKHAAYILHLHEWGFPLPVKSTSLNPYRGNNPHQGWSSQTFSF